MEKSVIIKEIKKIALANNGKPPGVAFFTNETGIKKSEWYPILWLRWSDALIEAGFQPNLKNVPYEKSFLIKKYIELIEDLGHFPLEGEIRVIKKTDHSLPSHNAFRKLGSKQERALAIIEYCKEQNLGDDIIKICEELIYNIVSNHDVKDVDEINLGYVYLIKHGSRNEYKIGKTYNPLRREGEIRLQLPEKINPIHYIETDDPSGIESYWHNRFKDRRKEGEWFVLTTKDVKAFKK